jgi:plastocyanin
MNRRVFRMACTAALAAVLVTAVGTKETHARGQAEGERQAMAPEVKIDNFAFGPQTLTVPAGTTVTWTNRDDIPHSVVSGDSLFKSKALDTDDKFSFTFAKAGTYSYFCGLHPKMTGKVVVQ